MEVELSLEFVRVVEEAAVEAARTMGRGDTHLADQAAVEAMRRVLETLPVAATVVIGEGERDEAPMLYIGEKVGGKTGKPFRDVDLAVDPLEGTNLCATGAAGAITVLAASEMLPIPSSPACGQVDFSSSIVRSSAGRARCTAAITAGSRCAPVMPSMISRVLSSAYAGL